MPPRPVTGIALLLLFFFTLLRTVRCSNKQKRRSYPVRRRGYLHKLLLQRLGSPSGGPNWTGNLPQRTGAEPIAEISEVIKLLSSVGDGIWQRPFLLCAYCMHLVQNKVKGTELKLLGSCPHVHKMPGAQPASHEKQTECLVRGDWVISLSQLTILCIYDDAFRITWNGRWLKGCRNPTRYALPSSRLLAEPSLATTFQGVYFKFYTFYRCMFRPLLAIFRWKTQLF
jgi:hypothetical protein